MDLNAHFWRLYIRVEFHPQIDAIVDTLEKRVLSGFENIEQEAEQVSEDAWNAFMERPGTGDEDPADFAEEAEQAGVSHYMLLDGIRQGMLNLFAAALYHAFEQQAMLFHRRELLARIEVNELGLFMLKELCSRLLRYGIHVTQFQSWDKLQELRLLANAVKHAQGKAAEELHSIRPDMYQNPKLKEFQFAPVKSPHVFQPLVGEDLYIGLQDVKEYRDVLKEFWQELSDAMELA